MIFGLSIKNIYFIPLHFGIFHKAVLCFLAMLYENSGGTRGTVSAVHNTLAKHRPFQAHPLLHIKRLFSSVLLKVGILSCITSGRFRADCLRFFRVLWTFQGITRAGAAAPALTILTIVYCVDCLCYQPHELFQIVLSICFALFGSNCFENVKISSKCSRFTNIFTWFIVRTREDCNSAYRALNHSVTHT